MVRITPIYKPFRASGSGTTLLRGLTNHYQLGWSSKYIPPFRNFDWTLGCVWPCLEKKQQKLFSQMVLLKKRWFTLVQSVKKNTLIPGQHGKSTNQPTNQEFWTNPVGRIHSLVKWWSNGTCGVSFWQKGGTPILQIKPPPQSGGIANWAVRKIVVPSLKLT